MQSKNLVILLLLFVLFGLASSGLATFGKFNAIKAKIGKSHGPYEMRRHTFNISKYRCAKCFQDSSLRKICFESNDRTRLALFQTNPVC